LYLAGFLTLCSPFPALALIIQVPGNQPTIQDGINAAANGDTILVAPGTYRENVHFRKKGITVASRFLVTGNPAYLDSTIIDGSNPVHPDTASCVLIVSDSMRTTKDTTASLIGFTLTGGTGTRWLDEHGAGTYREGGGVLIQYLSPRILHNKITGNHTRDASLQSGGGGIRIGDGNPRILNNVIVGNTSGSYGGGIVLNYTGATVRNNIIAYDTSGAHYGGGGGIWINAVDDSGRSRLIENNTIFGDGTGTGSNLAGGVFIGGGSHAYLRNNIIWGNRYSQIRGNATATYCDVQGGYTGQGNINRFPAFLDTVRFYLSDTSACIDAGDSSVIYNDPEDPRNPGHALWPSRGLLRNDMGAYGGPGRSSIPTGVEETSNEAVPSRFTLEQNHPNPFSSTTSIRFNLREPAYIALAIYNVLGEEVAVLVRGRQPAGIHAVSWDGRDPDGQALSQGVYFYLLQAGERRASRKMILMR
jgi:hypothetical protein